MATANTDKLLKAVPLYEDTLSAAIPDGSASTFTVTNGSSGLTNNEYYVVTLDWKDQNGNITGNREVVVAKYTSATKTFSDALRGQDGTSAIGHSTGAKVQVLFTAFQWNTMLAGLSNVIGTDGAVNTTNVVTPTGTQTLTNKTLTSPKIVTALLDSNGNEVIKTPATTSAVNEVTITNSAAGNSPTMSPSGDDTNIGLDVKTKGSGRLRKPTIIGVQVFDSGTDVSTGDGKAFFRVPAELNGMNLTGAAMSVYTAGTTNTTDIQIRNKTDSVDMLSTKLTIDSGETDSSTAATAAVIDTTKDDVVTGDVLAIDIDATSTTKAKGLYVELRFELP